MSNWIAVEDYWQDFDGGGPIPCTRLRTPENVDFSWELLLATKTELRDCRPDPWNGDWAGWVEFPDCYSVVVYDLARSYFGPPPWGAA